MPREPWDEPIVALNDSAFRAPRTIAAQRSEVERGLYVLPVEELDAMVDGIMPRLSHLRSVHGPGGTRDEERKAFRSAVANGIADAMACANGGKKPAEAELERLAAADPSVVAWIEQSKAERAEYEQLEEQHAKLMRLFARDQALINFSARMAR